MRRAMTLLMTLLTASGWSGEGDFKLKEVRLQLLPTSVDRVIAQPDGKLWMIEYSRSDLTPDAAKAMIAREFPKRIGFLKGISIVLTEPNNRIWFSYRERVDRRKLIHHVIGYDGKTWWVPKMANDGKDEFGILPRLAHVNLGRNISYAGVPIFVGFGRLHYYLKGELKVKALSEADVPFQRATMFEDPYRHALVVFYRTFDESVGCLLFKDNVWTTLDIPQSILQKSGSVFPVKEGYLCTGDDFATVVAAPKLTPKEIAALVADLESDDFKVRKTSNDALERLSPMQVELLNKHAKDSKDPEVTERLKAAVNLLKRVKVPQAAFGNLVIEECVCDEPLNDGSLLIMVVAGKVDGNPIENRLVRIETGKPPQVLPPSASEAWTNNTCIVSKPEPGLWFDGGSEMSFFSFREGKITIETPNQVTGISDMDTLGRLYVTARPGGRANAVACFWPGKPEIRRLVKPVASLTLNDPSFVFADGASGICIEDKGEVFIFQNGKVLTRPDLQGFRHLGQYYSIYDKLFDEKWARAFYCLDDTGEVVKGQGSLAAFIAQNSKLVAKRYARGLDWLTATEDGKIWVATREFHVFDNGWSVIGSDLEKITGAKLPCHMVMPAYNGQTVYATDSNYPEWTSSSFFLSFDKGKLVAKPALDRYGKLTQGSNGRSCWLQTNLRKGGRFRYRFDALDVIHFDKTGKRKVVKRQGELLGVDANDKAWIIGEKGELKILDPKTFKPQNGGFIPLNFCSTKLPAIVPLKDGSVLLWIGLHFAKIPTTGEGAYDYSKAKLYSVEGLNGFFERLVYAGGDHLCLLLREHGTVEKFNLYFVAMDSFR